MYIPDTFKVEDRNELIDFISEWNFGELITSTRGRLNMSHIPFLVDRQNMMLYGHLARQNSQYRELEDADDLLISFSGPHAYVSPNWYQTAEMVPTWNFQTVQVRGKAELVGNDQLLKIITGLSQKHEAQFEAPWLIDKLSDKKLQSLLDVIVGFKITIEEIVGKYKLSQNRGAEDQAGVIAGLEGLDREMDRLVAGKMRQNIKLSEQ